MRFELKININFCVPHLQGAGFSSDHDNYLDRARSVVVPILEILAVHTNHITCVRFECATIPLLTLLGESCRKRQCSLLHTDCQ